MIDVIEQYRKKAADARMFNDDAALARARAFDEAADILSDAIGLAVAKGTDVIVRGKVIMSFDERRSLRRSC